MHANSTVIAQALAGNRAARDVVSAKIPRSFATAVMGGLHRAQNAVGFLLFGLGRTKGKIHECPFFGTCASPKVVLWRTVDRTICVNCCVVLLRGRPAGSHKCSCARGTTQTMSCLLASSLRWEPKSKRERNGQTGLDPRDQQMGPTPALTDCHHGLARSHAAPIGKELKALQ